MSEVKNEQMEGGTKAENSIGGLSGGPQHVPQVQARSQRWKTKRV